MLYAKYMYIFIVLGKILKVLPDHFVSLDYRQRHHVLLLG